MRALRVLLAAVLMPVMLILTGPGAHAAAGDWEGFSIRVDISGGPDVTCTGLIATTGHGFVSVVNGQCRGGYDVSPFATQPGEPGSPFALSLKGGDGCAAGGYSGTTTDHPDDGVTGVASRFPSGSWNVPGTCVPTELCFSFPSDGWGEPSGSSCIPYTLDFVEPPPPGECASGTVHTPEIGPLYVAVNGSVHQWFQDITVRITDVVPGYNWSTYKISSGDSGTVGGTTDTSPVLGSVRTAARHDTPVDGAVEVTWKVARGPGGHVSVPPPDPAGEILGIGFIRRQPPRDGSGVFSFPTTSETAIASYGVTDPPTCRFYYGAKAVNFTNSDADEPFAPFIDEGEQNNLPEPPAEVIDTPETPPEADWWTALWAILKQILGFLTGLVSAIGELFKTLFIPDPSSWGWSDLYDQMEARPPVSLVMDLAVAGDSVASGFSGAGSCGILADFSSSDMPNAQINCGTATGIPGYGALYTLVQVALWGLTGLGVWNILSTLLERGQ